MAKATYAPMFETVSGALNKIDKKSPHAGDQKMVLATHRKAPTESQDCNRIYLRKKTKRATALSTKEIAARTRFAAVKAAVADRAINLTTIGADQQAFEAQKNTVGGKKTFNAYLWKVCGQAYDQEHPRS